MVQITAKVIESSLNKQKFEKILRMRAKTELERKAIYYLSYIGEEAVKIARERGSYNDITGNLRSSIGYVILVNGKPVLNGESKTFSGVRKIGDKEISYNGIEGTKQGKKILQKLHGKFPTGIVLIVCAGMKYAAYVEDIHHKDVLATAKLEAEQLANQLLPLVLE